MDTIDGGKGANPQIEDGHIKIANEIAEALARFNFSAYETRILWVIWRKTYGWHKKADHISITQFQKETGLHRRHIQRTIKRLVERNIIASRGYNRITSYQFQKDYTKWREVASKGYPAPLEATDRSLKRLPQKHLTKALNTGRSKKQTDPRVRQFLDHWRKTFLSKTGQPYVPSYGKDGKLIGDMLQVHPLEKLEEMVEVFFQDDRCKRRGLTVGIFFQELNRLMAQKGCDPLEEARRRREARARST